MIKKASIILFILISSFLICFSQQTISDDNQDFPILENLYNLKDKNVDFTFVIDRSGSMKNYWQAVVNSTKSLVQSLPENDYLSVIGFETQSNDLLISRSITAESAINIIKELELLPPPKGRYTDLICAIDKTINEINRPNSNAIKIIFILSDFINSPPTASKWGESNLQALKDKYEKISNADERVVKVIAIQLPLSQNAGKHFNYLNKVFGDDLQRVFLDKQAFREFFERKKLELNRDKLSAVVNDDLKHQPTVERVVIDNNSIVIHVSLDVQLPFTVTGAKLFISDYEVLNHFSASKPGEDGSFQLTFPFNNELLERKTFLESNDKVFIESLSFQVSWEHTNELAKLNINPSAEYIVEISSEEVMKSGIPLIIWLPSAILIILLIAFQIWRCTRPVWTFKKKKFRVSFLYDGVKLTSSTDVLQSSKRSVSISHNVINNQKKNIPDFTLTFSAHRPSFPLCKKSERGTIITCQSTNTFYLKYRDRRKEYEKRLKENRRDSFLIKQRIASFSISTDINNKEFKIRFY